VTEDGSNVRSPTDAPDYLMALVWGFGETGCDMGYIRTYEFIGSTLSTKGGVGQVAPPNDPSSLSNATVEPVRSDWGQALDVINDECLDVGNITDAASGVEDEERSMRLFWFRLRAPVGLPLISWTSISHVMNRTVTVKPETKERC